MGLEEALEELAQEQGKSTEEVAADAIGEYLQVGYEMSAEETRIALKFVTWLPGGGQNPEVRLFAVMILRMIDHE